LTGAWPEGAMVCDWKASPALMCVSGNDETAVRAWCIVERQRR
jgi:hypothetical protein